MRKVFPSGAGRIITCAQVACDDFITANRIDGRRRGWASDSERPFRRRPAVLTTGFSCSICCVWNQCGETDLPTHRLGSTATVFSRPYLSNGWAIIMIVCPSVCHRWIVTKLCKIGPIGCYWLLIENRVLAFKWHVNHWPWITWRLVMHSRNALWYAKCAILWLNGKS